MPHQKNQALMEAIQQGNLEAVKTALDSGASVESTTTYGNPALLAAATLGFFDIVRELVQRGANLETSSVLLGDTALHRAASNGYLNIVKLLIENGANVNATDRTGDTPLHAAIFSASPNILSVIKFLVANGANIHWRNNHNKTPFDVNPALFEVKEEIKIFMQECQLEEENYRLLYEQWELKKLEFTHYFQWLPREMAGDVTDIIFRHLPKAVLYQYPYVNTQPVPEASPEETAFLDLYANLKRQGR